MALTDFGCLSKLQRDAKSDNGAKQEFWWETKFIPESFFFFLLQETNISWEIKCFSRLVFLFFSKTKSLSTIYCLEMQMFSVWYVPMHLCGVVLVCGSLLPENVWNKVFTIKSTRTESYNNTCTLKYLYSVCLIYRRRTHRRICHKS